MSLTKKIARTAAMFAVSATMFGMAAPAASAAEAPVDPFSSINQAVSGLDSTLTATAVDAHEQAQREAARKAAAEKAAREQRRLAQGHLPTSGYHLTAHFGQPGPYWSKGYHTGLDFAAPIGTDIYAVWKGEVVSAGWAGAYGNQIKIQHPDGVVTTYNHLSAINVVTGQSVATGEKIGDLGTTGNSTGPHLHLEALRNDVQFDPYTYLAAHNVQP